MDGAQDSTESVRPVYLADPVVPARPAGESMPEAVSPAPRPDSRVSASDLGLEDDLMASPEQHQPVQQHEQQGQQPPQQRVLQDSLAAIKLGGARLASMVRNAAAPLRSSGVPPADYSSSNAHDGASTTAADDSNTMAKVRATAGTLGARAKDSAGVFLDASLRTASATAEGLRRLALGEPVQALCRAETARQPVPQLVLACCTALTAGGLSTERLFKHDPPQELVDRLSAQCSQASLLAPGTSPHAIAALLKQFLLGLPEPLLTYRLLPDWVAAADKPESSQHLLKRLPVANANTLRLLLQLFHYINENSAVNEMDSLALAEAIAPCLGWTQAPPQAHQPAGTQAPGLFKSLSLGLGNRGSSASAAAAPPPTEGLASIAEGVPAGFEGDVVGAGWPQADSRIVPLEDVELEGLVIVIEHLISHFVMVFG